MDSKYMGDGFRWCPHCGKPHRLAERICPQTGSELEAAVRRDTPRPHGGLIGTVLDGKYRILRTIGSGGAGIVFEAENLALKRLVAIKIVSRPGSAEAILRLEHEAMLVAAIQHPNICNVYDVGRLPNGGPYVVLERLVGETLSAHMKLARRPSLRVVVDIFVQVLSGLHGAHTARIVHRDLKPQNIFLAERLGCPPIVKILDFGFAQQLTNMPVERITRPGKLCGTVPYMSPEQLRAEPLDHRSDLFAVGVMLYEMFTGRHPFAATSQVELMTNIVRSEARMLRKRRPDVTPEVERLVMTALSKDPSRRAPSAYVMLTELAATVRGPASAELAEEDEAPSLTGPLWIPPSASQD